MPQWRSIFSSLEYVVNVCGTHQLWNMSHISRYFLELEKLLFSLEYIVNVCGTHQPWNKCYISGYFLDLEKNATIRRRGAHIANVVPGPRPRTGFGGGDIEHCLLLWWYAVGADQATKLHIWCLIFHCQCIGNGKRRRLVCPPSCRN